ncbi:MAG TPA: dicarboxylate/amino acid:cation symporter [Treponema sp.]|nr:dicarboxylate/amino acid:cation symporter [Treponema sp.]
MKIWIKYVLASILGSLAAFLLPLNITSVQKAIDFLTEISIRFGRYMLVPLLFFSMVLAIYKLRNKENLFKTALYVAAISLITSLVLVFLGILTTLLVKLPRIPISVEKMTNSASLDIPTRLLDIFPITSFSVFLDGNFLLPLLVLAGFIGAGCASDTNASKLTVNLFDSLSKVFFAVMSFFVDMFAFGMIFITCTWTILFKDLLRSGVFTPLILLLAGEFILIAFILYPLVLKFVFKEKTPYRVLYASTASLITAFFSGDINLSLGVAIKHLKESLGLKRRIAAVTAPVFSVFARGGTALVTATAFIVILRSYSGLIIPFGEIIWIGFISFLISFFLGGIPIGGAFLSLTILCSFYGRGFDAAYLLLKPMAFVLGSFATAIDTSTMMFGSYFVGSRLKMNEHRELKKYI